MHSQRNEVQCDDLCHNPSLSVLLSQSFSCPPGSRAADGMALGAVNRRAHREEWQASNLAQCALLPPPVHRLL